MEKSSFVTFTITFYVKTIVEGAVMLIVKEKRESGSVSCFSMEHVMKK